MPSYGMQWHPSGVITGSQILTYQRVLASLGFMPNTDAALDGRAGPQTTTALRAYQLSKRINGTGLFDAPTLSSLDDAIGELRQAGAMTQRGRVIATSVRAAVTGSHPTVAAITTAPTATAPAATVTIPPQVAQMIPPSTVAQLQTMPAPQVQSFVNDLVRKVETAENTVLSEGTGKDFTAVPMVGPDGTVVAAVQQVNTALQGLGWWASLTPNERIGYGVGGAVAGVVVLGTIVYLFSRKD